MTKDVVLTVRVPEDLRDEINEIADENGLTQSELIREALEEYLVNGYNIPTKEELFKMEWSDLCDLVDDQGLDIDCEEIDTRTISIIDPAIDSEITDNLRARIMEELNISDDAEKPGTEDEE